MEISSFLDAILTSFSSFFFSRLAAASARYTFHSAFTTAFLLSCASRDSNFFNFFRALPLASYVSVTAEEVEIWC